MSSLGFHYLYETLNSYPQLAVERCYLPDNQSIKLVLSKYLSSFETATPLANFNIIAFSVSYESDFINVLRMLKLAKIPFKREERLAGGYPLLICGGPASFQNIIPMYEIFDLFAVGSGEATVGRIVEEYTALADSGKNPAEINAEIIRGLSGADNFFAPSISGACGAMKTVKCAWPEDIKFARTVILTKNTEFRMRALIETVRGCVRKCKFCMVGNCYGRFRHNGAAEIEKYIDAVGPYTNKIGLLGPAVSAHPEIVDIYKRTRDKNLDISMSSIYINEIGDELIRMLSENEQKNITVAVESACEDVRNLTAKKLSDADIFENLNRAVKCGIKNFKIYFILGLYDYFGKNGGDEAGHTINFISSLNDHLLKQSREIKLKISVNPLVIKPRTALFESMPESGAFSDFYSCVDYIPALEQRYKQISKCLKASNIEFSEKNFADSALLKYINECCVNLFDFFDDFFYNEPKNSRSIVKIMQSRSGAFDAVKVKKTLFKADFKSGASGDKS